MYPIEYGLGPTCLFLREHLYLAMHKQPRNFISFIPMAMDMPTKVCFKYFVRSDILALWSSGHALPTEKNLELSRTRSVRKQPKTHIKQIYCNL